MLELRDEEIVRLRETVRDLIPLQSRWSVLTADIQRSGKANQEDDEGQ